MESTDIQAEVAELRSLQSQIRVWRTSLVLLLVALIVISVSVTVGAAAKLVKEGQDRDKFVGTLMTSVQKDVVPKIKEFGSDAVRAVNVNKQMAFLSSKAPMVTDKALEEMRGLSTDVPEEGKKILTQQFEETLKGRAAKLKQEFPDVTDEQINMLLSNLTEQTQVQLKTLTDDLFQGHIDTMNSIIAHVDEIRQAEKGNVSAETPTWEIAFLIVDIARADFDVPNPADEKADAKPAAKTETKPAAKKAEHKPKAGKGKH